MQRDAASRHRRQHECDISNVNCSNLKKQAILDNLERWICFCEDVTNPAFPGAIISVRPRSRSGLSKRRGLEEVDTAPPVSPSCS